MHFDGFGIQKLKDLFFPKTLQESHFAKRDNRFVHWVRKINSQSLIFSYTKATDYQ